MSEPAVAIPPVAPESCVDIMLPPVIPTALRPLKLMPLSVLPQQGIRSGADSAAIGSEVAWVATGPLPTHAQTPPQ